VRLLLLRHGQTISNVHGVFDTEIPGPGLTDLGRRQAAAVPEALAGERIAAIYVSRLRRTAETAAPLARATGLDPVVLAGLDEVDAGDLEGGSDRETALTYMGTVFAWAEGRLDLAMPGSEDGIAFFARYDAAVNEIERSHLPDATVAAFSHGAAIRVWAGTRSGLGAEFVGSHYLDYTGLVVLEGSGATGWTALSWGGVPIGGAVLADREADDLMGEPASAAIRDAD
jgi:probable phosphoglycerate mutase